MLVRSNNPTVLRRSSMAFRDSDSRSFASCASERNRPLWVMETTEFHQMFSLTSI